MRCTVTIPTDSDYPWSHSPSQETGFSKSCESPSTYFKISSTLDGCDIDRINPNVPIIFSVAGRSTPAHLEINEGRWPFGNDLSYKIALFIVHSCKPIAFTQTVQHTIVLKE